MYKVYDLIKGGEGGGGPGSNNPPKKATVPPQNLMSPVKGSELFINQVMQAPRMTNYEQLKRPKTNREDATARSSKMKPKQSSTAAGTTGFRLNSQRGNLQHLEGVISTD